MSTAASSHAGPPGLGPTAKERLLEGIRALGRLPKQHPKATAEQPELRSEHKLAVSLKNMRQDRRLTAKDEEEIQRIVSQDVEGELTACRAGGG